MIRRAFLLLLVAMPLLAMTTAPAAANNVSNASYYNDSNTVVNNASWYSGQNSQNASATNLLDMVVRVPEAFIGPGEMDSSGTGFQGIILTGLLIAGIATGAMGTGKVGPVGGVVLSLPVAYALTDVGLAPVWLKPILLFAIGIAAAVAILRVMRR